MHNRRENGDPVRPPLLSGLSAFLPAFNEAANLSWFLPQLRDFLPCVAATAELIVVDDGSTDDTIAILREAASAAHTVPVRIVRHAHNRGYGAAVRSGLAACRLEWAFLTDADGQFEPQDLPILTAHAHHADLVCGRRAARADPLHRRLYARTYGALVRALLDVRVRDVNCAFKLLRRETVAPLRLESEGALISAELLARAQQRGARIVDVPTGHRPRRLGRPTGGDPRVVFRALRELMALRRTIASDKGLPLVASGDQT